MAALTKTLKATPSAMGIRCEADAAISGMDGIAADFPVFADRFLTRRRQAVLPARPTRARGAAKAGRRAAGRSSTTALSLPAAIASSVTGIVEQAR
jgi:hypothetical protein